MYGLHNEQCVNQKHMVVMFMYMYVHEVTSLIKIIKGAYSTIIYIVRTCKYSASLPYMYVHVIHVWSVLLSAIYFAEGQSRDTN